MIRRLLVLFAAVGMSLLFALPASATGAGAVTFTQTFHNATQTFPTTNPCNGATGTVTITYNGVFHITLLTSGVGAGTGRFTATTTGDFTFAQDNGVTYTGHFTAWDGASSNLKNFAATAIFVVHGTGSDGSTLRFHDVAHLTVLLGPPPSVVVSFDKPSCG